MNSVKLDEITAKVADAIKNGGYNVCQGCNRLDIDACNECKEKYTTYDLLDIIASLHNELYKEVTGNYYDYMYHWANFGYGGNPNDHMFKDGEKK